MASRITNLRLDTNHFTMLLSDPYAYLDEDDEEDDEESVEKVGLEMFNEVHISTSEGATSLSHLRTMLPESSNLPLPAQWPNHAT